MISGSQRVPAIIRIAIYIGGHTRERKNGWNMSLPGDRKFRASKYTGLTIRVWVNAGFRNPGNCRIAKMVNGNRLVILADLVARETNITIRRSMPWRLTRFD